MAIMAKWQLKANSVALLSGSIANGIINGINGEEKRKISGIAVNAAPVI